MSGNDAKTPDAALGTVTASGQAGYELLVFSGEAVRTFALPRRGSVTIGRGEQSTILVDDPSVSREHAVLSLGDTLEIEDLGTANGTLLRDRPSGLGTETLNLRHIRRGKARIFVGDSMIFGTASVVVRHAATLRLPDLATPSMHGAGVVVQDAVMRALFAQAARAARSSISVLLFGETGVGKEVLARAIHAHSPRSAGPFMGINCAALSESLLESELFGSDKGAFTGALHARTGLFEASNGGTVFLDEVGELPLSTQAKLLRVLEERVVTRLGSTRLTPIDVRVVAATNRDIETTGSTSMFRRDLYFRLNGISLTIPPLRERPSEVETFAQMFLVSACRELELSGPLQLSPGALDLLRAHAWPGNVRELRNAIDRAAVLCTGNTILPEHLPPSMSSVSNVPGRASPALDALGDPSAHESRAGLASDVRELERSRIVAVLERCSGNQTKAAELLGISRRTLVSRMSDFGLRRPRKPQSDSG